MTHMNHIRPLVYRRISPNSIRLFQINNHGEDILSGRLEIFTLNQSPKYHALSYCWGAQEKNIPVEIDGEILNVSRNLSDGLKQLREIATEDGEASQSISWLWIDQLCINQQDVEERSEQVQLIGSIYERSIRTLIWLGNASASSSNAWLLIDQIYDIFKRENPRARTLADIPLKVYSKSDFAASGLPDWAHPQWKELRNLLEIPWFTRIWVIQEVALSQQDPIILHGRNRYPWKKISWAAAWLRRNGYLRMAEIPNQLLNVDAMSCIRRSQSPWNLDALLCFTSAKFHASDQRDKVYGLLGLASETKNPSHIPDVLRPNYRLDVTQVYQDVARFIFQQRRNLATLTRPSGLGMDSHQRQQKYTWDHLPSWVPYWGDFNVVERQMTRSLSWLCHSNSTDMGILGFPKHYNASGGLPVELHASRERSSIRLSGFWIEDVTSTVQFIEDTQPDLGKLSEPSMLLFWRTAASLLSVSDTMSWIVSYIKTTTAEHHALAGRTEEQMLGDGAAWLLKFLSDNEQQIITSFTGEARALELIDALQELSAGGKPEVYAALSRNYCFHRSFFVTTHGRMGIGPLGTQLGDNIAVLLGGGVPYVIRKGESGCVFIGESYVPGLMQGEAVEKYRRGESTLDILELH